MLGLFGSPVAFRKSFAPGELTKVSFIVAGQLPGYWVANTVLNPMTRCNVTTHHACVVVTC
ncbi:hypothetical protein DPMN_107452 [Dreissena polymorpha]|uniref:Uncharacterized protein n=1 Tax=Dreissena polymorpha TaxID=45954 RepID=A0A9D4QJU3_DREPO|nr:hypothetical protein DPMN_107356 [Dreissena polymorpha]KAH3834133.1 hypothetical protein DPMN_107452 [Dreissena polymorpha]